MVNHDRPSGDALFVDANIPIYAGGQPHPLQSPCREIILLISRLPDTFVTDAEVLQEMLHRYIALRRGVEGTEQVKDFAELMRGHVEPLFVDDVERAVELTQAYSGLQARDLAHLAVMHRLGITRIVSADRGFDGVPDIERLDPARLAEWQDSVIA